MAKAAPVSTKSRVAAQAKSKTSNAMWGGRFSEAPSALMQRINASIFFDHKLYAQDIRGSIAHAQMLAEQKIISAAEAKQMVAGLKQIEKEIAAGKMVWREELEDIHMHVESRLKEIIGPVAGKLHTARSRNDQVATDFKLFVRDKMDEMDAALQTLQATLLARASQHANDLLPGFTHLQIAQPVSFGHHLLAYVEMFGRDRSRLQDARKRMNESPLGSAALAGTPYPINRHHTAKSLGFSAPTANSLDGVSDRDFTLDFLSAASISMMHLSRLAEELIHWSTPFFGFVTLSDAFTSGSSIMPQKKNPDAAELVRGKTGRVYGSLMALLTTLKALPLAYNKDMQEDKEPLFDAAEQWSICVAAMNGMMADMKVHTKRMDEVAGWGYATATDLADWLVRELGLPFREAHHVTGRIVALAVAKDCALHELSFKEMQAIEKCIRKDVFDVLTPAHSAASRLSFGGTAPANVKKSIVTAKKKYL